MFVSSETREYFIFYQYFIITSFIVSSFLLIQILKVTVSTQNISTLTDTIISTLNFTGIFIPIKNFISY
jgi:hypothetical protein